MAYEPTEPIWSIIGFKFRVQEPYIDFPSVFSIPHQGHLRPLRDFPSLLGECLKGLRLRSFILKFLAGLLHIF
jgi:hypothetical protein